MQAIHLFSSWRIQHIVTLVVCLFFLCLSPLAMGQFTLSQPGFSLRAFPDTPAVGIDLELGIFEQGPTTTVENEDFIVSARRVNSTNPFSNSCYILFARLEKSTEEVLYKLIKLPRPYVYSGLDLGMDLDHDEDAVMIATVFESEDLGVVSGLPLIDLLAMKIQISPFSIVWAKTDRTFDDNIRTRSVKLKRSYTSTGTPSGYTFIADCFSEFFIYNTFYAMKWGETGVISWARTAEIFDGEITDAEAFEDKLVFTGAGDPEYSFFPEIYTYRLNTTTGVMEYESVYTLPNHFLHHPKISLNIVSNLRKGYFLTFNRDQGSNSPVVVSAKNDGSIRWSKRLNATYQSYGIQQRGSEVFVLARPQTFVPPLFSINYSQFVLDKPTGNVVPGKGTGFQLIQDEGDRPHYLKGYQNRRLTTASFLGSATAIQLKERLTVAWVKEHSPLALQGPYDCPVAPPFSVSTQPLDHLGNTVIFQGSLPIPVLQDVILPVYDLGEKVLDCLGANPPRQSPQSHTDKYLSLETTVVSPNPASKHITLSGIPEGPTEITLIDLRGKALIHQQFSDTQQIKLSIATLTSGVYLLNIRQQDQTVVRRFVKQ